MLIESIKLENFRQFQNESITFADGSDGKNVTIILGENGSGKTTFAQAFFWCMYGETSFSDKRLLNSKVASKMIPGSKETVRVELCLKHGLLNYVLTREQVYVRDYTKLTPQNSVFAIATRQPDGTLVYEKRTACEDVVKNILPKELSRYFFFDGERIEKMSKDIAGNKKSDDFAQAVNGLLGLNGMLSAISHFKGSSGVVGSFDKAFDRNSDVKLSQYAATVERCQNRLDEIATELETAEEQREQAEQRMLEKAQEIKKYDDGKKLQREKEQHESEIKSAQKHQAQTCKEMFHTFDMGASSFFSKSLIYRALQMLKDETIPNADIPYMHVKTIEYLLRQKKCICGTHLDEGTVAYENVKALMDYLPPQSISTTVSQFKKDAKNRIATLGKTNLSASVAASYGLISDDADKITDAQDDLRRVESQLATSVDVAAEVRKLQNEIFVCKKSASDQVRRIADLTSEQDRLTRERDTADTNRRELSLKDDKNRMIEICRSYALEIYNQLSEVYKKSETEVRTKLQATINEIFNDIYDGGLSLSIDEKYHITVTVNGYGEDNVETSTAQSISVIFAFIAGIIKMARENKNTTSEELRMLESEPYPLVMDAPLSAFDKKRIASVCKALPDVAEQVIIFIKDTDGDLAEKYMSDKIESRHRFDKVDEFETHLA